MLVSFAVLFSLLGSIAALPTGVVEDNSANYTIALTRKHGGRYSDDLATRVQWLQNESLKVRAKYAQHLSAEGKEQLAKDLEQYKLRRRASIPLLDTYDSSYSGLVSFGFELDFDTGSTDLWVTGTECTGSLCSTAAKFKSSKSTSFKRESGTFEAEYGTGDVSGYYGTDTISVAGISSTQELGVVTKVSVVAVQNPQSGIFGLAFAKISGTGKAWWEAIQDSGKVSQKLFTFWLKRTQYNANSPSQTANGGQFTIGSIDTSKYTGNINWISIPDSHRDYWRISIDKVTLNGAALSGITNRMSLLDTGTSLIGAPYDDIIEFYAKIPGSRRHTESNLREYWQYPCTNIVKAALTFGGVTYNIDPVDFSLTGFTTDTSMCTGSLFYLPTEDNSPIQWIAGDSFLKNVYSIFRNSPTAIGLAVAKQ